MNELIRRWRVAFIVALLIATVGVLDVRAGNTGETGAAITTADPSIAVEELELLVKPLTRDELVVEADAWRALVQSKAAQIADAEIAVIRKNRALDAAKEAAPESDSGTEEAEADAKTQIVAGLVTLRAQRAALIERGRAVLASLERKGGEIEVYQKYFAAVSGVSVDVTDAGATWVTVTTWLRSEDGGVRWLLNIVKFLVTLVAFILLSRVVGRLVSRAVRNAVRLSDLMRDFIVGGIQRTILALGFVMALGALEVNIGPLLAVVGAAGFVVAFALQSTLGNFASGIMILAYRPFDVGDVIEAAGVLGKVASMNLVSTTIKTPDNKVVVVPNNALWGNVITNVTGSATRRVDLVFGIGYADDIAKAQEILERCVAEHPKVLSDPAPVVRVNQLGDSSVNFVCRPWARTADYWDVYWDLTRKVKEQFDANGVTIPFPQRDVHIHKDPAA